MAESAATASAAEKEVSESAAQLLASSDGTSTTESVKLEEALDQLELENDYEPPVAAVDPNGVLTQVAQPDAVKKTSVKRKQLERRLVQVTGSTPPPAALGANSRRGHSAGHGGGSEVDRLLARFKELFVGCCAPCGAAQVAAKVEEDVYTQLETKAASAPAVVVASTRDFALQPAPEMSTEDTLANVDSDAKLEEEQVVPRGITPVPTIEYVLPPISKEDAGKQTLVLDLDETLVHSSFKPVADADFIVPINIEGQYHNIYVLKRPHVDEFLQKLGSQFEVVIFTASMSNYANPVCDLLDTGKVIKHRLFREHCVYHNGKYVKDLRVLGRPLESTFILDNAPDSYMFQPENGIPCTSWFSDPEDDELLELVPFMEGLKSVADVRAVLGVEAEEGAPMEF